MGGFKRQVDGSDSGGWGIAAVSPDDFVRLLSVDVRHPAFQVPHLWSNNTAELTGLAEVLRWIRFFIPRGEREGCVSFIVPSTRLLLTLGVAHARRNFALARKCNELSLRLKYFSHDPSRVFPCG